MTNQHPIIPPKDLVRDWHCSLECPDGANAKANYLCAKAAQWGADQELEACCREVQTLYSGGSRLRARRRPQPPSLKEQALEALKRQSTRSVPSLVSTNDCDTIRRALEALPND